VERDLRARLGGGEWGLARLRRARTRLYIGVVGSSSPQADVLSEGRGVRPLRVRSRRGGERSCEHSATTSLWRTARVGRRARFASRVAPRGRHPRAWTLDGSWHPGGRDALKPLSLFPRRAPCPLRPCRGVSEANEPAFTSAVDEGSGSGDPDAHCNQGERP
jgi:hypothetical protein